MPRTITDSAQVSKATLDTVRDITHDWHDPSVGHYFIYLREQASIADGSRTGTSEEAGDHITDEDDNSLYDVRGHSSSDDQLIIRANGVGSGYE